MPISSSLRCALFTAIAVALSASPAGAVRPFITDDARVVGRHRAQFETWVRADAAALQHWVFPAVGLAEPLELGVGMVHGLTLPAPQYALNGPVVQAKLLLHEASSFGAPGVGVVVGTKAPWGVGAFATPAWDSFGSLLVTQSLGEGETLLLHANVGTIATTLDGTTTFPHVTWGVGAQVHAHGPVYCVAELFSGDPYAKHEGGAAQLGVRYFVNHAVQLDTTVGTGVWGDPRLVPWGTVGLRIVTE
jgi:hypothetical protein